MLLLFLAHGQTMVGKDQKARSMNHIMGPRSSIDSENLSRNTTSLVEEVMERSMKVNIEPRDMSMARGVVDDLVGEIAAITALVLLLHLCRQPSLQYY